MSAASAMTYICVVMVPPKECLAIMSAADTISPSFYNIIRGKHTDIAYSEHHKQQPAAVSVKCGKSTPHDRKKLKW